MSGVTGCRKMRLCLGLFVLFFMCPCGCTDLCDDMQIHFLYSCKEASKSESK